MQLEFLISFSGIYSANSFIFRIRFLLSSLPSLEWERLAEAGTELYKMFNTFCLPQQVGHYERTHTKCSASGLFPPGLVVGLSSVWLDLMGSGLL